MHLQLPENFVVELTNLGLIALTGEQKEEYLQGQITTNVQLLSETQGMLACHCDFKGKMWNSGWLVKHSETLYFTAQQSALGKSLAELNKYGVFSKVDIVDASNDIRLWGFYGPQAKKQLERAFGELNDDHMAVTATENRWVLTLKGPTGSRFIVATPATMPLPDDCVASLANEPQSSWNCLDAVAGIAAIHSQTSNEFVPQMLNMQALGAIDFNKGCYMGQEVVARTKYLGKNKRAAYLLTGTVKNNEQALTIAPGDILEKAIDDNWRRGGSVLHVGFTDNQVWLLAVLSNDSRVGEILRLKEAPDTQLTISELPYSID
ncbi:tRNA-modifying protein YgfZ [Alteromonas sp. ASW11-36]|uniref:tRNA-modifying protein YgfZ n=1 Tax=Alteromonas arenosi TaxID=3055817 RepID=A0ABT7SU77_9ALTE|nr:tRNA-modifying protein YgfZ [Alteromonas sp. ASW11-36]MDM7859749.1 tRNA-modifying protein YgfZ [Alteromonas sp. ASW11-36]